MYVVCNVWEGGDSDEQCKPYSRRCFTLVFSPHGSHQLTLATLHGPPSNLIRPADISPASAAASASQRVTTVAYINATFDPAAIIIIIIIIIVFVVPLSQHATKRQSLPCF